MNGEVSERRRNTMPYFDDVNVFYDLLVGTFDELMKDPEMVQKALDSNLTVRFIYRNPEGEFWIDNKGDEVMLYPGGPDEERELDATMIMDLDTAHAFWCGQLNLLGALSSGEIEAEGSMPRLLKMLPVMKPAYGVYVGLLEKKGLEDLIIEEEED
jgi:putative sterol carrier protein